MAAIVALGSVEIAEKKFEQKNVPVYMYMFTHESNMIVPAMKGSCMAVRQNCFGFGRNQMLLGKEELNRRYVSWVLSGGIWFAWKN